MARTLNQVLESLPAKRRAKIEQRASELATLQDVRQAFQQTQKALAKKLGVGQDTVSRIERSGDNMLLSTLRRYVTAMGGEVEVVARFPNRKPVVICQATNEKLLGSRRHAAIGKRRAIVKRITRDASKHMQVPGEVSARGIRSKRRA